ncbi:ATP-binding protein [Streptomyces sp. 4N509B]|uniref:ATP-binding protein n=1 Tax=Streptomyces sp. 4N509B TaxID=3457413 RepID=UPI003FD54BFA
MWWVPPALLAVVTLVATVLVPADARLAAAACGAVATLAVASMAGETVRRGRTVALLRRRIEGHLSETDRLAREVLPAVMTRARRQVELTRTFEPDPACELDPRMVARLNAVVFRVTDTLCEMELQRDSGKHAIVNVANRIQSEINRMRQEITRMQFRHGAPGMLNDLMRVEHGINVAGRFAAGLAVLGGGGPVRRWTNAVSLYDVMRAGSGPINEYLRVEQQRVIEVGVRGDVVEPLIIILGELLDNATRYSPPTSMVIMNSEEVATGVEVSVEDKGTGLTEEKRRRAEFLLHQGVDGIDMEDLGETARLGLRVAGILASQIGARISLRPSTCDGVRAVVFVPQSLLAPAPPMKGPAIYNPHPAMVETETPPAPRPGTSPRRSAQPSRSAQPPRSAPPSRSARPAPTYPTEPATDELYEYERAANGLPQRRLRRALENPVPGAMPPSHHIPPRRPAPGRRPLPRRQPAADRSAVPPETGEWVEAFFAGVAEADARRAPSAPEEAAGGSEPGQAGGEAAGDPEGRARQVADAAEVGDDAAAAGVAEAMGATEATGATGATTAADAAPGAAESKEE